MNTIWSNPPKKLLIKNFKLTCSIMVLVFFMFAFVNNMKGQNSGNTANKEVKFFQQNGISLSQAHEIAYKNLWIVATEDDVRYAWKNLNLNVYAFGMMASGRFAVPVQSDHSNFKTGPNIDAKGGNQGFFYVEKVVPTQWGMLNDGNFDFDVFVDGKKVGSLEPSKKVKYLPINYGDEVSIKVKNHDGNGYQAKYGYSPIIINKRTENPLVIKPQEAFDNSGLELRNESGMYGIDLTEFNPMEVSKAFKPGRIFEGLLGGTYNYYKVNVETFPNGFASSGHLYTGKGNFSKKTVIGVDKLKEAWSVGAKASVPIPIPQKPDITVTPEIDFNYGESIAENSSETDVFICGTQRKMVHYLAIFDINEVVLSKDFIRAVESINSVYDATNEVINIFGTHFTDNVFYGGHYHSYIRIHEDSYYKKKDKSLSLTAAVEVAQSTAGETTGSGSGELSFDWSKTTETKDVYGDITSKYSFVGGKGNRDNWDVDPKNSVAISVGQLFYISDLVKPEIFKTAMDEDLLAKKREFIKLAIDQKLTNVKYLKKPKPYRSFQYRIKSIEYVHYNDDANTRLKGNLIAQVLSNGNVIQTDELWNKPNWSEENKGGLTSRDRLKLPTNRWINGKQIGVYNGNGTDASMSFAPLSIRVAGTITDKDDCCFDTGHDVLKIVGNGLMDIKNSSNKQEFSFELDHFFTEVEKMRLRVNIEVIPLVGF
ncbi:MAG: MAC/perforin domain-containing protein [Saprospiraceae bacterium]|nr:MAC/perforin domain-containing protein [Saprospiraceae bacterium]